MTLKKPKRVTAKVICAWCEKQIGLKEWDCPDQITHGICKLCKKKLLEKEKHDR